MTEIFEEVCPYYLSLGMTLTEYWEGPPHLVKYYRQKQRIEIQNQNQMLWLQGLYFKSALDSSLSQLFKKKGSKGVKYLEKPLEILPKTEEEKEREAIREREKAVDYFNRIMREQQQRKQSQKSGEINVRND